MTAIRNWVKHSPGAVFVFFGFLTLILVIRVIWSLYWQVYVPSQSYVEKVFQQTTVEELLSKPDWFPDGSWVKLRGRPFATAMDSDSIFGLYGYMVYELEGKPGQKRIYLLSKCGDLRGCDIHELECQFYKGIRNARGSIPYLVDTKLPEKEVEPKT